MCGLVGWISSEKGGDSYDRRKFIDQALILDTVRGGDSTGVFVVEHSWKKGVAPWADWRKQLSGGHEFILTPEYKELFDNAKTMDYKFCVGHNRSATLGGVVLDAAHPFTEGPITLVHNGTVNHGEVNKQRLASGFVNDSHTICHMLSKDTPENVIKQLDGAFALIWHDARDDSLNFVRNAQRPMHMAKSAGNDTIYFASEAEMLYWLDRRLTLKLQDIVSMKPAHLLKFKQPKLMVPEVSEVALHVLPKAHAAGYTAEQWSGTSTSDAGSKQKQRSLHNKWMDGLTNKSHAPSKKFLKVEYPEKMEEDLLEFGLFHDQEEEFIPTQAEIIPWKKGNEDCTVMGWLMPLDKTYTPLPAVLHGLVPNTWTQAGNRVWTVYPLGIAMLGWETPVVVCRLRSTSGFGGVHKPIPEGHKPPLITANTVIEHYRTVPVKPKKAIITRTERIPGDRAEDDEVQYPGPKNRSLDKVEWYLATKDGCMGCEKSLTLGADAWNLEWVLTDTGIRPLCCDCIDIKSHDGDDLDDSSILDTIGTGVKK